MPLPDAKSIFLTAIELALGEERQAYLEAACGENKPLRQRVQARIAAYEDESFLAGPSKGSAQDHQSRVG